MMEFNIGSLGIDTAIVWNAFGIWALSQLGYALIVQLVKKRLEQEL